jgi:predicted TIM-barrel fold metal-dependent hydrolase
LLAIGVYFRENVYHTFGLQFPRQRFSTCCWRWASSEIMFSVDHPYGSMLEACSFLDQILVSASDRERIAHRIGLKARRERE